MDKLLDLFPEMEFFKADGFDEAIIGMEPNTGKVIYDIDIMAQVLVDEGLSETEALEYLDYNVLNAYVGELTPIYIKRIDDVQ